MKKIILLLVLSLSLQSAASFATTQSALNVRKDVAALIEHAQSHSLSAEQTLLLAQQAIDQAAHLENASVEVPQNNHKKMMIIAGVVVAVVVIGGVAYYYYYSQKDSGNGDSKKITTALKLAEELVQNFDEIFVSSEKIAEWMNGKGVDLDDTEKVYMVRAFESVRNQGNIFDENSWRNFLRDNLVRLVKEESVKMRPASAAEVTEARRIFAKKS